MIKFSLPRDDHTTPSLTAEVQRQNEVQIHTKTAATLDYSVCIQQQRLVSVAVLTVGIQFFRFSDYRAAKNIGRTVKHSSREK
jgi:hypothetical protein